MTDTTATPEIKTILCGFNPSKGTVFLATADGQRIDFPPEQSADIAAMLETYCLDNGDRAHVEGEWCELDDEDAEYQASTWTQTTLHPYLSAFPTVDTDHDCVASIIGVTL